MLLGSGFTADQQDLISVMIRRVLQAVREFVLIITPACKSAEGARTSCTSYVFGT